MFNDLKQKATELYNRVIENVTIKNASTAIIIGCLIIVLWNVFKMITSVITGNWYMALGFIIVLCVIANYFHKPLPINKPRLEKSVLEYIYKMFRKHMYKFMVEVAEPLNLKKPAFPNSLDAPVRWSFIGNTAVYHNIVLTDDKNEEVETDLIMNKIQLKINQALENGTIDGKENVTVIYEGYAMPRIFVHEVEQTRNMVEISIVFVDEEYAKNHRNKSAGDLGNVIDIQDIEDDDI